MPHLSAMEWDFAERLRHITKGTTEAYYNYDGSGERVRKVVEKGNIVEERLYLGGFEIFRKKNGNSIELERETLHIMDDTKRIALVETLTIGSGSTVPVQRYQLGNNIESATLELDGTANIISYEEYYPYGDTSYQAGRSVAEVKLKRYRYTGKEKDEESGLYYYSARYYNSMIGIFMSTDPMFEKYPGVSSYAYCLNNPLIYVDPTGMIVEGVSEVSAKRVQKEIHNTFQEEKFKELQALFNLSTEPGKENQMQRIDEEAFNKAIANLSDDERALANAYFLTINSDDIHYVDMTKSAETLNPQVTTDFELPRNTKGSYIDEMGGGKNVPYKKREYLWKNNYEVSKIDSKGSTTIVVIDSKTSIPDFVCSESSKYLPKTSAAAELLAHELLGHGYSHTLGRIEPKEQHQDAIQMTNLYLRVKGEGFYRDGTKHGTGVNLGKETVQKIPSHFKR
jgi:RHS repeat-associated protein